MPHRTTRKRKRRSGQAGETLTKVGGALFGTCIALLVVGRAIVTIFFPHLKGTGLTPEILLILIPIWSIGIAGLLCLLAGWLKRRSG
jgi:hypothetical protein